MIPDLSDYKWIVPDIVWEIDEYIDLGLYSTLNCFLVVSLGKRNSGIEIVSSLMSLLCSSFI